MNRMVRLASTTLAAAALGGCATRADLGTDRSLTATVACLPSTASRIAPAEGKCSALSRSYSGDDIRRTGATTAGRALQMLDPSITARP